TRTPGLGPARCTKLCHHKAVELKDDVCEKQSAVTINPRHMRKAFRIMNELRSQSVLCDVTIIAEDVEIAAHRVVLAAGCPYFHAMFTGEMTESRQKKVRIKEIDGWTLGMLIDYVYTAEIQVTEENVQVLLPAAGLLQLQEVKKACCEFLTTQLHPTNCLGICAFADLHACTELLSLANTYAEQHFSEVVQSEEFLNLGMEQVCSLIASDKLTIPSEEKVTSRVMREHCFHPVLTRISETSPAVLEAFDLEFFPVCVLKVMMVVGGQAPKAIRSVECYDFEEERWFQVAELPSRRCRAGVVYMGGVVYAVGGFNGSLRVRTVDAYDPIKDEWCCVSSMQDRRSTLGSAVLNGLLYAVGGFDGSTGLATVEAYNAKANEWFHVSPMNTRRSSVGVGVVGGLLYAVGGYDGATRQCLSTVEVYNPNTNEWSYTAEMGTRRSGAGVGVLKGLLYAVGGHDGPLVRKSCEVYDPATNTWKQVADMNMCRRNAGVCAVNNLLYVVGGDDGSCNLASVELYNPNIDKWSLLPTCMSTGRSYAGQEMKQTTA
uniref:Kelch-like family member 2 n=1 Tax=Cyprinus carpio TaxID=7962 RepID=A0A8C2GMH4_CYPCA